MQVARLLRTKGTDVVVVAPDQPVAEVLAVLARHRIGAVVVSVDGTAIAGVLSERDVVAALADRGAGVLDEPAARLMTDEVVTCEPDTTIEWLMATMTERRIRHVPVVVDEQLAGLVSIGDVVKHHVAELEHETQAMREYITHPY